MKTFLSKYNIKNIIVEIITSNKYFISFSLGKGRNLGKGYTTLKKMFKQKNTITEIYIYLIDDFIVDKVLGKPLHLHSYHELAKAKNLQIDSMEALEKKMDLLMGEALLKNI